MHRCCARPRRKSAAGLQSSSHASAALLASSRPALTCRHAPGRCACDSQAGQRCQGEPLALLRHSGRRRLARTRLGRPHMSNGASEGPQGVCSCDGSLRLHSVGTAAVWVAQSALSYDRWGASEAVLGWGQTTASGGRGRYSAPSRIPDRHMRGFTMDPACWWQPPVWRAGCQHCPLAVMPS